MRRSLTAAILTLAFCQVAAVAQPVLSAKAGMVTFSDGPATLNGTPVEIDDSRGLQLDVGQSFATQTGPAEVLLGTGSFLRLAPHSSMRMLNQSLTDPEVALEAGTLLLEVADPLDDAEIRLWFAHTVTTIDKTGLYRFQASNTMLMVFGGNATLRSEDGRAKLKLGKGDVAAMRLDRRGKLSRHGDFDPSVTDDMQKWSAARSFSLYETDLAVAAGEGNYHPPGNWVVTLSGTLYSDLYHVEMESLIAGAVRKVRDREQQRLREQPQNILKSTSPPNFELPLPAAQQQP